ncbi:GH116 family glycosyl hydrolase [Rubellicoccus peritrichatus]|uniref:GH116 family glycosyl hydrolase n=1 Tax=Rubellicoccus peritrichatus TaxID=3080537 RepID=A0AAQ3LDH2_9BACT|nr:GH116 family glycosyl hydrolase [Puniceicoccus sp. CR14]WOO43715.1 GH116 family glycosyl hydrolase [Puniceicoccus sp. CR14]
MNTETRLYNNIYEGKQLDRVAFPLGGIGAGMICLDGNASFSNISLRHRPEVFNQRIMFSALNVKQGDQKKARILQGRTPDWKIMFPWNKFTKDKPCSSANGGPGTIYGLPYFQECSFAARFPFATVDLSDPEMPVGVQVRAWSPFVPGQSDDSSLPVAGVEYTFHNRSKESVEAVFYHAADNFMKVEKKSEGCGCGSNEKQEVDDGVRPVENGFVLYQSDAGDCTYREGAFAVAADQPAVVNSRWFRGGWFDAMSVLWKEIENGELPAHEAVDDDAGSSNGGSLAIPFKLEPGESHTVRLRLAWYVPKSDLSSGLPDARQGEEYQPWYAQKFKGIDELLGSWLEKYDSLQIASNDFANCLYSSTLPPEVLEAITANLSILKSPTVLRQNDGRIWAWEGCFDDFGCCSGTCTHVWNYAQAMPHLFPDLERTLRQSEFYDSQDDKGHQNFRASMPIGEVTHDHHAAADGQLGGIMKIHRDWKISGDTDWLRAIWPKVQSSLQYCIDTWDPDRNGTLIEPHHNTYDIEFWGADGMCTSFYLGALKAAAIMAEALGEDSSAYQSLYEAGRTFMEGELFNGEYFIQKIQWEGLKASSPADAATPGGVKSYRSPESRKLLEKEGPKYQYGNGCLSDGVLGQWMAEVCGVGEILDQAKVRSHLNAVYRYNFRKSLHNHANPQRPTYALNDEAGLLLCSWPHGDRLTLPFVYSEEVWTGIEYQVASHLIMMGEREKGVEIVRAVRSRYDGRVRNPFDEYECGHWYARAMSSYSLFQAFSGARYDAVEQVLYLKQDGNEDYSTFLCTENGYGQAGIRNGKPFLEVASGVVPVKRIQV